jgi:nucleotide-binding universal stress UspA family protein
MIRISHVLCPVDLSDTSLRALHYASAIAGWYEAKLTALHMVPLMPVMDLPPPVLDEERRAELLEQLQRFTACVPRDVRLALRVEKCESVHEAIQTFASSEGVDLLVMGSHGRSGFKRILLGSVAERVIRQAPCPTMIVSARAHDVVADAPVRFRTILCPVDFSDNSLLAAEYAVNLAEETDAQLRLLHVLSMPPGLEELELTLANVRAQVEGDRLRRLEQLIPAEAPSYCTVQSAVRSGAVHQQILAAADEQPSDLIVLGAHGRGAVDAAFFGSNAARVARGANCPVLVVRQVAQPRV